MLEKIWAVQDADLLLRLSRDDLRRLENQCRARSLPPDCEFPFSAGAAREAYLISAGRLIATAFPASRSQPIQIELTPNDFFGVIAHQDLAAASSTLMVAERTTVVAIPQDALQQILNARGRQMNSALRWARWSCRRFQRVMSDNFFVSTEKRVAKFLFDRVAEHFVATGVTVDGLSPKTLAKLLNSSPDLVAACLADFEQEEILFQRRWRLEIVNLSALADIARMEIREPIRTGSGSIKVFR